MATPTEKQTDDKPENQGPGNIPTDALNYIAAKFKELRETVVHQQGRIEALEKNMSGAAAKELKKIEKEGGGLLEDVRKFLDDLFE
ncbi:MAG: hypothetical protein ACYCXG_11805 [Acidiferrobacter sp.]